jgi:hypothetical protein
MPAFFMEARRGLQLTVFYFPHRNAPGSRVEKGVQRTMQCDLRDNVNHVMSVSVKRAVSQIRINPCYGIKHCSSTVLK